MKNNTFFIVAREKDLDLAKARNYDSFFWNTLKDVNRDKKEYTEKVLYNGWEFVDGIELFDYNDAKELMYQYREAMPNHTVLIHCKEIKRRSTQLLKQEDLPMGPKEVRAA